MAFLLSMQELIDWLNILSAGFVVFGPATKRRGETIFEKINDAAEIDFEYSSTMASPRKFIYPARQDLFDIFRSKQESRTIDPDTGNKIIFGIHPCDMHAVSVLDRTFFQSQDFYYKKLREETVTMVLNCNRACSKQYPFYLMRGFCASMGTGPFLRINKQGYDIELTKLGKDYLLEPGSPKGKKLIQKCAKRKAGKADLNNKRKLEKSALSTFTKSLETKGLPELLSRNWGHPVYARTADARCLNCTNCTMVCPTCYCYNVEDSTSFDLEKTSRSRCWDSCQELNFAKVHGGNFRSSRRARLRQFVTHKLSTWIEQYGCFGCIGCGRCMTWCPTHIDLTEMAQEIQQDQKTGKVK